MIFDILDDIQKKSRVGLKKVEVTSTFLGNSTGQLLGIWEYYA